MATASKNLSRSPIVLTSDQQTAYEAGYLSIDKIVFILLVLDFCCYIVTTAAVALIYWGLIIGWIPPSGTIIGSSLFLSGTIAVISLSSGSYRLVVGPAPAYLWSGVLSVAKASAVLFAFLFLAKVSDELSRIVVMAQLVAVLLANLTVRAATSSAVRARLGRGSLFSERYVVVQDDAQGLDAPGLDGTGSDAAGVARRFGARMLGRFGLGETASDLEHVAARIVELCRSQGLDRVVICTRPDQAHKAGQLIDILGETPVTVEIVPSGLNLGASGLFANRLPTAVILNKPLRQIDIIAKRALDLAISGPAVFLLSPLFVLIAIAIRLETPGPVLFRQVRHGYNNNGIRVFKFRSMRVVEDGAAFRQATRNDSRITRVGRFLRASNLDELPQLLNVLLGEMSIVGPRPHPVALNETFAPQIRLFHRRHNIRPGITGWAQINGLRGETDTLDKMLARVQHDLWYIDNWSLALDLKVIALTLFSAKAYRNAR